MHEQSLEHVFVTAHVRPPKPTSLVEMRTGSLQQFPTSPKQASSAVTANPASIRIDGVALPFLVVASGSCGCVQSLFDPFFFRFRSIRAKSARVGVPMPEALASVVRNYS